VAAIGSITVLLAALIALTQDDIKRILAFSTISQLGYMMMGLGVGSFFAGTFHLATHAFFKALLFLGAGSVIHGSGTQDIWAMGGLRKRMPHTFWTFLIGSLALAGIAPLAGFWSKDAILDAALEAHAPLVFATGLLGAGLTAFYMTRLVIVAFLGDWRGPSVVSPASDDGHDTHAHGQPHESPPVMTGPLWFLAVLAIVAGFAGVPWANWFGHTVVYAGETEHSGVNVLVMGLSTLVALGGIGLGGFLYPHGRFRLAAARSHPLAAALYRLSKEKFYFDEFYWKLLVENLFRVTRLSWWLDRWIIDGIVNAAGAVTIIISKVYRLIDTYVVDGIVNLIGWTTKRIGIVTRYAQGGQVQSYLLALFAGAIVLLWILWNTTPSP
jgi:NADH-quinone oxidoreductase subunit L